MLRLLLIFLGMIFVVRLISAIARSFKFNSRGSVQHKEKSGKEVGEGWIVEDRIDENKKVES